MKYVVIELVTADGPVTTPGWLDMRTQPGRWLLWGTDTPQRGDEAIILDKSRVTRFTVLPYGPSQE